MRPAKAVSFDFGQTLAELDTGMLARRLGERGVAASPERLEASVPEAWRAYDAAIRAGVSGHPWKTLMARLLALGGVEAEAIGPSVDWLWTEQPRKNLWRRPLAGMIDVVRELVGAGVPVAILSNSEGRVAELAEELGWRAYFAVVADSGKLGVEKPDRAIFDYTAQALGVSPDEVVHVGDSRAADVDGALRAGFRAIWFRGLAGVDLGPRGRVAADASATREALRALGGFDVLQDG